ncbi:MAG: GWxTD domain-containing protein [Balneolales bacterium]
MNLIMRQAYYLFFLAGLVILSSCSSSFDPEVRTGATPQLIDGQPDIRISAIGFYDDDKPVLDVDTDIIYNSLIYSSDEGIYEAGVGIQIQVMSVNDNGDGQLVENHSYSIDVEEDDRSIIESTETINVHNRLDIGPGKYEVIVSVTDKSSRKTTRLSSNAVIFDRESGSSDLTHIKILGIDSDSARAPFPLTTYDIPGRVDSLRFQYYITRPETATADMSINMRLIEFESDTLPPRHMSAVQPSTGSIEYRGINYNRSEVLEESNRTLRDESGTILIEYTIPRPVAGNFRFQVMAQTDDNNFRKARDFSSKSDHYPHIETSREMARPLAYLMGGNDYERLMEINDADSLKKAIDSFWYSNIENLDKARRVIELYYTRVEEANKQFSSFKEGWMTDMGMIYVLFGPPNYVERSLDNYFWIYGYNRGDARQVFRFHRTRTDSDSHPFSHYILLRQRFYHSVEYQKRQEWLSGTILDRL